MATDTIQGHIPSSKSERNLIILQVNLNAIKTISRISNCLFTIHLQISPQFRKPRSPLNQTHQKYITSLPCVPIGSTRRKKSSLETVLHSLQQTTFVHYYTQHRTSNGQGKVHINDNKHITIANIYIPPRDSRYTHYKTADTDIQYCIQYITNIPHCPHRRCERTLHSLARVH